MNGSIVRVYAHWCGHCQAMNSYWDDIKSKVNVIDIEEKESEKLNEVNQSLKTPLIVKGYPTIAKIRNGVASYFTGNRTYEDILKWCLPKKSKSTRKKNKKSKKRKSRTQYTK
jgi:glutaredoxin